MGTRPPSQDFPLPNEMLAQVFQRVTDPAEQFKLLRTFDIVRPLMKWDENLLYFKLVYPLIQRYLWTDWQDVWRLCQVSPEFMEVVLDHFKSGLSGSDTHISFRSLGVTDERVLTQLVEQCESLGRTEWMAQMPFLVCLDFLLGQYDPDEGLPRYIHQFLDAHGEKVWTCEINMIVSLETLQRDHEVICGMLSRMPNLVSLSLNDDEWNTPPILRELSGRNHWEWPDLPLLRSLETGKGPFALSLMQRYARQLQTLVVEGVPPVPEYGVRFPKLQTLTLVDYVGSLDWLVAVLGSVETLVLLRFSRGTVPEDAPPDQLRIPTLNDDRFNTNIWTHAPRLEQVQISTRQGQEEAFTKSRAEHQQHEQTRRIVDASTQVDPVQNPQLTDDNGNRDRSSEPRQPRKSLWAKIVSFFFAF